MKFTKTELRQIIKEELEAVMAEASLEDYHEPSYPRPGGEAPYDTKNFQRLSAYGKAGKNAQEMIRKLYAAGNYAKLGSLADYSASMDLTKGRNDFGFQFDENPEPRQLKRTQNHFFRAFRDAHMNRPKEAPEETPEEKPSVMDRIKGFFTEE